MKPTCDINVGWRGIEGRRSAGPAAAAGSDTCGTNKEQDPHEVQTPPEPLNSRFSFVGQLGSDLARAPGSDP